MTWWAQLLAWTCFGLLVLPFVVYICAKMATLGYLWGKKKFDEEDNQRRS